MASSINDSGTGGELLDLSASCGLGYYFSSSVNRNQGDQPQQKVMTKDSPSQNGIK